MRRHLGFLGVLICALAACDTSPPQVSAGGVTYHGHWLADGEIAAFLGIPFAEPPVGNRRWTEPVPPAAPAEPVDRSATRYAAACMQGPHMVDWYRELIVRFDQDPATFPVPEFSEDCLYLNVWSPAVDRAAGLPVMVWIHGGSHRGGWSYEPNYAGQSLAGHGVIVVSIAYRLDIFGFFSHPDLPMSNFGLLDQVAALRWVQRNIAAFGGDPGNVTAFGESAGAASIGYLLASPFAEGLFHRAIHQSGGYQLRHADRREAFLDAGVQMERLVTDGSDESGLEGLRAASPESLLAAAESIYRDYQPDAVVDGHTLVSAPRDLLEDGRLAAVDLMIGTNADEWRMYLDADTDPADVERWLVGKGISVTAVPSLQGSPLRQLDRLITADLFVCPSLELATYMANSDKSSHVYLFSRARPGKTAAEIGAYHGIEIPYVFNTHDQWLPTNDTDREITLLMQEYWTAFARSGNPDAEGLPHWPSWHADRAMTLEIAATARQIEHPERLLCELLPVSAD